MPRRAARQFANRLSEPPRDNNPRRWGARCDDCPLKGATPVFGDGPPVPLMAFVGEAPGQEEVRAGLPFIGRSGSYLEALLQHLQVARTDVWVDNGLACFPPGGDIKAYLQRAKKEAKDAKLPWHSPIDCCRPRLFHALGVPKCSRCARFIRGPDALVCRCKSPSLVRIKGKQMPDVTVPLGNSALESCSGLTGITERRGYWMNLEVRRRELVGVERLGSEEAGVAKRAKKLVSVGGAVKEPEGASP